MVHLKIEGYSLSLLRILDHIEESKKGKEADVEEGRNIKQQVDMYEAAKQAIEEQRRKVSEGFLSDNWFEKEQFWKFFGNQRRKLSQ